MTQTSPGPLARAVVVAERYGISTRTVYRLAKEGRIPCYRAGWQIRFDLAAVEAAFRSAA